MDSEARSRDWDLHLDRPGGGVRDSVMDAIRGRDPFGAIGAGESVASSSRAGHDLGVARNTVAACVRRTHRRRLVDVPTWLEHIGFSTCGRGSPVPSRRRPSDSRHTR